MQLSIIIISYKTPKLTLASVKSIYRSLLPSSPLRQNFEIIVVDNYGQDQTLVKLKALKKPNLKLIVSKKNLGFAGGNNLGFKHATGQYVLFLNSDTTLATGVLEKLVAYYQVHERDKKPLGLLAAQLLNQDGSYQAQGGDLPTLFTVATTMFGLDDLPLLRYFLPAVQHTGRRFNPRQIAKLEFIPKSWVAGTAVLIKRDYFEDYGGWDENIFMYGEDQELSYRLKKIGFRHGILTTSRITHLGSGSSNSQNAILGELKGYFYFFRRYQPAWQLVYLKAILWFAMLFRFFFFSIIKKDTDRAKIYAVAFELVQKQEID
jgi:GT2 family glycosyltransferase